MDRIQPPSAREPQSSAPFPRRRKAPCPGPCATRHQWPSLPWRPQHSSLQGGAVLRSDLLLYCSLACTQRCHNMHTAGCMARQQLELRCRPSKGRQCSSAEGGWLASRNHALLSATPLCWLRHCGRPASSAAALKQELTCKAAEVVDARLVVDLECPAQALHPPLEALLPVRLHGRAAYMRHNSCACWHGWGSASCTVGTEAQALLLRTGAPRQLMLAAELSSHWPTASAPVICFPMGWQRCTHTSVHTVHAWAGTCQSFRGLPRL